MPGSSERIVARERELNVLGTQRENQSRLPSHDPSVSKSDAACQQSPVHEHLLATSQSPPVHPEHDLGVSTRCHPAAATVITTVWRACACRQRHAPIRTLPCVGIP